MASSSSLSGRAYCARPRASAAPSPRRLQVTAAATGLVPPQPKTRAPGLLDRVLGGGGGGGTTPTDASDARQRRVPEQQRSGTGTQLLPWFSKPARTPEAPVELRETARQPILSFAGGGIFFWWELGCLKFLHRNFDLRQVQMVGASAGGLICALAACGVDEDKAVRVAHRLAQEYGVFERPAGLAGIWGALIREWLDELLPEDAAERCRGRVRLVVTEVPSLRLRYLEDFESKEDLIDACMTTVHIPFFLDGNASRTYRGQPYIDGSLWDFLLSDNSELIKCNGEACVVDYFNDDQLKWGRLDFIKLADLEQVQAFVQAGTDYAERTDAATDCFERVLGDTRKGTVRRVLEVPLWAARRTLASIDG